MDAQAVESAPVQAGTLLAALEKQAASPAGAD
jgi:hypothetical protein